MLTHQKDDILRIVGLEIEPFSLAEDGNRLTYSKDDLLNNQNLELTPMVLEADKDFSFTYSINTVPAPGLVWANRMDHYIKITSHYENVYTAQLAITFMIIFVLTVVVLQIFQWVFWQDSAVIAKI